MKRTTRKAMNRTICATLAVMGAAPGSGTAQEARCAGVSTGSLGISGLTCEGSCTMTSLVDAGERYWTFSTEPLVTSVEAGGPSDGVLRSGDRIVSIGGMLITTREGGRRFGSLEPGETVRLQYRRGTRVVTTDLKVEERCETATESGRVDAVRADTVRASVVESTRRIADALRAYSSGVSARALGATLGIGFNCGDCSTRIEDGRYVWSFSGPVEIYRVEPGGPADRAGLRSGDMLRRIDGVPIESPQGGERFSSVEPGEPVRLMVTRRDGSAASLTLVPEQREERVTVTAPDSARAAEAPSDPGPVRFSGGLGPATVVVRGAPVTVIRDSSTGVLIVRTVDTEVRITVPPGEERRRN